MTQITDTGLVTKTQNDYYQEITEKILAIDPNWNLDPSSPDGLKIAIDAEIFANLAEVASRAYYSKNPNFANGIDLDVLSAITNVFRKQGTFSQATVTMTGNVDAEIPAGSRLSDSNGNIWVVKADSVVGADGTIDVSVECQERGQIQADSNTITGFVDVIPGVQECTNNAVATAGAPPETNAQLRARRQSSIAISSVGMVDSMQAAIEAIPDVRLVKIYENYTSNIDSLGLPPHSVAIIVEGGEDVAIAKAIFQKRSIGHGLHAAGDRVTVTSVYDRYPQNTMDITFSRPLYIDIEIEVIVKNDGSLPPNANEQIVQEILAYATGTMFEETSDYIGFNSSGFDIAEDVPISRIYTPINKVIGSYGNSFVQDLKLNGVSANVAVAFNQLARFAPEKIGVTVL